MRLLYITNAISGAAGLERVLSIKTNYLVDVYNYEIHIIVLNQINTKIFY
ncbi:MAG: glycosyltransferase family 4 protein, partial [Flavobacterium sp.]|nr:glycosyltransferase family 4 protein [Flavobacterium sp.]